MKLTTNEYSNILLEEVFNPIALKTSSGEELYICMRDSGFEFTYEGKKYSAQKGIIEEENRQHKDLPKRLTIMSEFEVVCNHYLQNHYKMDGEFIDGIWHLSIKLIPHPDAIDNSFDLYSTDKNKYLNIRFESMKKYIEDHKIIGVIVNYE